MNSILRAGLVGAALGGIFTAIDGAVIGILVVIFSESGGGLNVVLEWAALLGLCGAVAGAGLGSGFIALASRMTLPPPEEHRTATNENIR